MKPVFDLKKLSAFSALASICTIIIFTAYGCNKRRPNDSTLPDSTFQNYITAYTGGIVRCGSSILIELKDPATNIQGTEDEINEVAESLFRFSPAIKGTARWINARQVEFTPASGELIPGKKYSCTFNLSRVADTDKRHRHFRFSFVTAKKEVYGEAGDLAIKQDNDAYASVSGTFTFSEPINTITNPSELLKCSDSESKTSVTSELSSDNCHLNFLVTGLKRGSKDRTVTISLNTKNTGFEKCGPVEMTVPAIEEFKVLDAILHKGENSFIDLTFSSPVDNNQNLDGLISLSMSDQDIYENNLTRIPDYTYKVEDNRIRIYIEGTVESQLTMTVSEDIRDFKGARLASGWTKNFSGTKPLPEVRFPMAGNIMPDPDNLVIPFTAANLKAVDISIIRIFANNIPMFLQDNDIDQDSGIRRAGRLIYRNTIRLDSRPEPELRKSSTYTVDLSGIIRKDPMSIYRICLSFKQEYYIDYKGEKSLDKYGLVKTGGENLSEDDNAIWDEPNPYYYQAVDWNRYNWKERNDPDKPSYYMTYSFPSRNLIMSEIGAIAKSSGNGTVWVAVSDILSGKPLSGADITVLNYQLQEIGKGKSNAKGCTEIATESSKPFIVRAAKGNSIVYLKVTDGSEKSLSRFDTGGETLQKGLKGYVYGERGVWRPGDTLHLNLILHGEDRIPDSHPAVMDVYTPQGQYYTRMTCRHGENGFYTFNLPTSQDSPTGIWNAYVKVGGATFHKSLRIETIMPNRLKIDVNTDRKSLTAGETDCFDVSSTWLTGPVAADLPCKMVMTLKPENKRVKGFDGYIFTNPTVQYTSSETTLLDKRLDAGGKASATVRMPDVPEAPGMMRANILCTVTEDGGDQSFNTLSLPYSPFSAYVGVKLPEEGKWLETGKNHEIPVAVINQNGQRVSGHRIEWRIFKMAWSWWWESRKEPLDSYVNALSSSAINSGSFISSSSKDMTIPFKVSDNEWGRYFVYIKDLDSGHAAGGIFFADWSDYKGRSDRQDPDAPAMLTFSLDKKSYKTGDIATVYIPTAPGGQALVSVEKGGKVLESDWVPTSSEETRFSIPVTSDMAPNFYIHITLVQPYRNASNDLPVRMYGVMPVMVENPDSHLEPVISMPERLHPEEAFSLNVREKNGKPMTYTIAIVDEGLLDLTAFKTPDPWNAMYRREALGVKTWDMYDNVFGAGGGALSAMFSIGGDEAVINGARKENRFNPVVRTLGPFTLKKGSSASHKISLPMYVGSVRVMVVAGNGNAYGNAEKTVPVTSPVMILPTLPRVAGCGEKITLPVNVFVMEEGIDRVTVSVNCTGTLRVNGNSSGSIQFKGKGDGIIRFDLSADSRKEGPAHVVVTAEGGGHRISEEIDIDVRNSSPDIISLSEGILGKGKRATYSYTPFKAIGENKAWLEAYSYPSIGWDALFSFMTDYPHDCTEQLAAKGLSLVYSEKMLSVENASKAKEIIPRIITALYSRQLPDGGFACWPGNAHSDEWVTSMAGEFLYIARNEGYAVSDAVLASWKKFQNQCVRNWRTAKIYGQNDLIQAYRLYTLALAQIPDEPAMNRMKEGRELSWQASMMLASCYSICGKKSIGEEILARLGNSPAEWSVNSYTYGTPLRDKAIAIEAKVRTGNIMGAISYAAGLSNPDNDGLAVWSMSTQESAFIAKAISLLAEKITGNVDLSVIDTGGKPVKRLESSGSADGRVVMELDSEDGRVTVSNNGDGAVYVKIITISKNAPGTMTPAKSNNVKIDVRYVDNTGNTLNINSLRQGTEFKAIIKVTNPDPSEDYGDMALTQIIPSGWEIINTGMTGQDVPSDGLYDYMDIRDDRSQFYFGLPKNSFKIFSVSLRAAYEGSFILPSVTCENMYNSSVFACTASGNVEVTR